MRGINFIRAKGKYVSMLAAGLVIGSAATVAFATIPDSTGTIHGCYGTGVLNKGNLRVIDNSNTTCKSNEASLNWNQSGASSSIYAFIHATYDPNSGDNTYAVDTSRSSGSITLLGSTGTNQNNYVCLQVPFTPKNISVTPGQGKYGSSMLAAMKDANGWSSQIADNCQSFPNANVEAYTNGDFFLTVQ